MKYSKGAEWRKWDLHIHTPSTTQNNQFEGADIEAKWCKYLKEIQKLEDICVLGITDYFSVEGYKKMLKYKSEGKLDNIQLLLPNVELRLMPVTGKTKAINYHIIFSHDIVDQLETLFFSKLKFNMCGNEYSCVEKDLIRLGRDFNGNQELEEKNAYIEGISQFKVDVDQIANILEKNIQLRRNAITLVANSNQDGVSGLQQQNGMQAGRRNIYSKSEMVFSGNPNDREFFLGNKTSKEEVIKECGSLKPCIHGSDAHSLEKICKPDKNRFTWIKADTTFEGLRQIINEPQHRVFIGEEPPLLKRLREEPENFLENISISSIEGYDDKGGVWFKDIEIPLNEELIAIIGNKGKGKSAIADILGLLGNSTNYKYFNFLHKDKFKREKGKKAKNFNASLKRRNFPIIEKNLNDDVDTSSVELVKYIPQSFFERITNNLDESFEDEVNNVIFSHLQEGQLYDNFDDLMHKKTETIKAKISKLVMEIEVLNDGIILLEKKTEIEYLEKLESQKKEKDDVLNSVEKPLIVKSPSKEKEDTAVQLELKELNDKLNEINKSIEQKNDKKNELLKDEAKIIAVIEKLDSFENDIKKFILDNKLTYSNIGINIEQVINYEIKSVDVKHGLGIIENELIDLKDLISEIEVLTNDAENNTNNLYVRKLTIEGRIKKISDKLDEPSKLHQEYIIKFNDWEERIKTIVGSRDTKDTIKYYENEIDYIKNTLRDDLSEARVSRNVKCKEIFKEKEKIVLIYDKIKEAIDTFISENNENLNEFKISLDSGYKIDESLYNDFFETIDGSKKGSFRGNNKELLIEIFETEIKTFDDLEQKLSLITYYLENDIRNSENIEPREISSQILKGKIEKLYNYLYSLDYIVPSYSLKLDNKTLKEISPGEKGALLLVFYLLLDRSKSPLIIDQPEDNLDNQSVFDILVPFIKKAKSKRQIIMVTHNPNLAVVADAEQIIYVDIDKKNNNIFQCTSGSIENNEINKKIVRILEGTMPAFERRDMKYQR